MECEMCGKIGDVVKTKVEGTYLNVCEKCAKHGKVIADVKDLAGVGNIKPKRFSRDEEMTESIVSNYNSLVKNKREQMGLKQEDFAKQINEKVSVIQHIEGGKFEPSQILAKKIEKFLGIKLIEKNDFEYEAGVHEESGPMTLGDMIKIKKK